MVIILSFAKKKKYILSCTKFDSQKVCNRKYIVFVLRASIVDRITDYHKGNSRQVSTFRAIRWP